MSVPHFGHVQPMTVSGGVLVSGFFGRSASFVSLLAFEILLSLSSWLLVMSIVFVDGQDQT
jgi:hypothetical protein